MISKEAATLGRSEGSCVLGRAGNSKCMAKGCGCQVYSKNLCRRHYNHLIRYGHAKPETTSDRNRIEVNRKIASIHLRDMQGRTKDVALIDAEDARLARRYKWKMDTRGVCAKGEGYCVYLARLVLGLKRNDVLVKNLNGDMLDCRKSNLKTVDREWLSYNSKTPTTNTSGYKGVSWNKAMGRWEAYLHHQGRKISGGMHRDIQGAVEARRGLEGRCRRCFGFCKLRIASNDAYQ